MTSPSTPYVTLEDAAKHFLVSVSTFRSWVRAGIVPKDTYIQAGSVYRFDLPAVAAALRAAEPSSTTPTTGDDPDE